jgi:hypothetical protein
LIARLMTRRSGNEDSSPVIPRTKPPPPPGKKG